MTTHQSGSNRIDDQRCQPSEKQQWQAPKIKEFFIDELTENSPGGACDAGTCS